MTDRARLERVIGIIAVGTIVLRLVVALTSENNLNSVYGADIGRFLQLGHRHGRPYIDYRVEYPVLALMLFKLIALWADGLVSYARSVVALNVLADMAIAGILFRYWGRAAAAFYLIFGVTLVSLVYLRIDAVTTLLALLGLTLFVRSESKYAGVSIGIATFLKLWPGWLALVGLGDWSRRSRQFTVATLTTGLALGLAWLAIGGATGIRQVLSYRGAKGWEIETIPGVLLMLRDPSWILESGAIRIGRVPPAVRIMLPLAAISIAGWAAYRSGKIARYGAAWVTAVSALLIFSALLSPQFIIWLLPGAAIAWVEGDRVLAFVAGACAPLTGLEMANWARVLDGQDAVLVLILVRNAVLLAALVLGILSLLRASARAPS
jgi:hypothetical protein